MYRRTSAKRTPVYRNRSRLGSLKELATPRQAENSQVQGALLSGHGRLAQAVCLTARGENMRPARNLAVDFYRVSGVVLIVLGHWLAGAVTYHGGQVGRPNPLVYLPRLPWQT